MPPGIIKVKCFKQLFKKTVTDGNAVCIDNKTDKDLEIRNITKKKHYNSETNDKRNAEAVKLFQDAMGGTDQSTWKRIKQPCDEGPLDHDAVSPAPQVVVVRNTQTTRIGVLCVMCT